jgi:hypothetical protein
MKKRILMLTLRGMFLAVSLVVTSHAESVQAAKPQKSTVMPVRAEAKKIESVTITPARTSVGANRMSVDERRLSAERELQQQKKPQCGLTLNRLLWWWFPPATPKTMMRRSSMRLQ